MKVQRKNLKLKIMIISVLVCTSNLLSLEIPKPLQGKYWESYRNKEECKTRPLVIDKTTIYRENSINCKLLNVKDIDYRPPIKDAHRYELTLSCQDVVYGDFYTKTSIFVQQGPGREFQSNVYIDEDQLDWDVTYQNYYRCK